MTTFEENASATIADLDARYTAELAVHNECKARCAALEAENLSLLQKAGEIAGTMLANEDHLQTKLAAAEQERNALKALITELIPFIGYEAHMPNLVKRAENTVDYGQPREEAK